MPPHPTFFVRRELYERFGTFNRAYSIAADYDLMFRFLYVHRSEVVYIPRELVRMATGGHSAPSPGTVTRANLEVLRSWMEHRRIPSPLAPVLKPLRKIVQFI